MTNSYRTDIDGLRAIAVLAVVLYHAGVSSFSGGFVGVDIFFVISGFLITQILLKEQRQGTFSIVRFYERRARRIFPALFLVLGLTTAVCWWWFLSEELVEQSRALMAATLFGSNFELYRSAEDYFAGDIKTNPLLHTWSLSVEEQFYLVFPFALLLIGRLMRHRLHWLVAIGVMGSFALNVWLVYGGHQNAAFYLPVSRAWELGLGALVAITATTDAAAWRREGLGLSGLSMILFSIFVFSDDTPFPGAWAAVPCVGTAMLLGSGSLQPSVAGRVLSVRPLVWIGLISYSLYLWHWPVLVIARYRLNRDLWPSEIAVLVLLSFLMAWTSWRFVEQPFRGARGAWSRQQIFVASGFASAVFVAIAAAGVHFEGAPGRLTSEVRRASIAQRTTGGPACRPAKEGEGPHPGTCRADVPKDPAAVFLLWGDSHARGLGNAADFAAKEAGVHGITVSRQACPPLLGVWHVDSDPEKLCAKANDRVMAATERNASITDVILVSRWSRYLTGRSFGQIAGNETLLADADTKTPSLLENERIFKDGLRRTVTRLQKGGKRIWLVAPVPEIGFLVPSVFGRAVRWGTAEPLGPSISDYTQRNRAVLTELTDLDSRSNVSVLFVQPTLCPHDRCLIQQEGVTLYSDSNHLSLLGSRLVAPIFREVMMTAAR